MISVITLGVKDLARSISFYRDGLGLPYKFSESSQVAYFTLEGTWLALYPKDKLELEVGGKLSKESNPSIVLSHNVASQSEVDSFIIKAQAAGATILKPPYKASWGGYTAYFSDPEGYTWEVVWNPKR